MIDFPAHVGAPPNLRTVVKAYLKSDGAVPSAAAFVPSKFFEQVVWRMIQYGWPPEVCGDTSKALLAGKLRIAKQQQNAISYALAKRRFKPSPFSRVHVEAALRLAAREADEFAKSHKLTATESLAMFSAYLEASYPKRAQKKLIRRLAAAAKKEADDEDVQDGPPVIAAALIVYDVIAADALRLVERGETAKADEICTLALARVDELPAGDGDFARARLMLAQAKAKLVSGSPAEAGHISENLANRLRGSASPILRLQAAEADSLRRTSADAAGDFKRAESLAEQNEAAWTDEAHDTVRSVVATEMAARRSLLERRGEIQTAEGLAIEIRESFEESSQHEEQLALADALANWAAILHQQKRYEQSIAVCDLVFHLYVSDESSLVRSWVGRAMAVRMFSHAASGAWIATIGAWFAIVRAFAMDHDVGVFASISGARDLLQLAKSSLALQSAKSVASQSVASPAP